MIELKTPRGLPAFVPESDAEDPSPKFDLAERGRAAQYYRDHGYAVIRGVIDQRICDQMQALWEREVKPSSSFIYRQATARAERHVFNGQGWVMNPILNLQSVDPREFGEFRRVGVEKVLANPALTGILAEILSDTPRIVQSMYFEGNSATWEHQDTYYLDSEKIGSMAAAWIALEDIGARAGRFFVCEGSHRIDMGRHSPNNNIVDHHEDYIQSVVRIIKDRGLEIRAPKLDKGDVLIWNARTIHGSLDSQDQVRRRASVTLHAIPATDRFLQLQNRIAPLRLRRVNGVPIHHPKDLSTLQARVVMLLESRFPSAFYALKRIAIRSMFTLKRQPEGT